METSTNIDKRIISNNKQGFEIGFKPLKLGAFIALAFAFGLFIIDMKAGIYFHYQLLNILVFIAFKGSILYTLYIAAYTFFSKYIVKLDGKKLSKYYAPIPQLFGNKRIERQEIESYYVKKSSSKVKMNANSNVRTTQTYYNLRIKMKNEKEFTFFYSLSQSETNLIKRLLDQHIK